MSERLKIAGLALFAAACIAIMFFSGADRAVCKQGDPGVVIGGSLVLAGCKP